MYLVAVAISQELRQTHINTDSLVPLYGRRYRACQTIINKHDGKVFPCWRLLDGNGFDFPRKRSVEFCLDAFDFWEIDNSQIGINRNMLWTLERLPARILLFESGKLGAAFEEIGKRSIQISEGSQKALTVDLA